MESKLITIALSTTFYSLVKKQNPIDKTMTWLVVNKSWHSWIKLNPNRRHILSYWKIWEQSYIHIVQNSQWFPFTPNNVSDRAERPFNQRKSEAHPMCLRRETLSDSGNSLETVCGRLRELYKDKLRTFSQAYFFLLAKRLVEQFACTSYF